jgi:hypothetical protein
VCHPQREGEICQGPFGRYVTHADFVAGPGAATISINHQRQTRIDMGTEDHLGVDHEMVQRNPTEHCLNGLSITQW